MTNPNQPEPRPNSRPKRKGAWVDVETFEAPESNLAVIVTERVRGAPAYSFSLVHFDDRGANKFIQVPCSGTADVEHVVYSLVKRAREFITQKLAEDAKPKPPLQNKPKPKAKSKEDKKGTRRGSRGKGGLSTFAQADARAGGHDYVGPTKRRHEKKAASRKETT